MESYITARAREIRQVLKTAKEAEETGLPIDKANLDKISRELGELEDDPQQGWLARTPDSYPGFTPGPESGPVTGTYRLDDIPVAQDAEPVTGGAKPLTIDDVANFDTLAISPTETPMRWRLPALVFGGLLMMLVLALTFVVPGLGRPSAPTAATAAPTAAARAAATAATVTAAVVPTATSATTARPATHPVGVAYTFGPSGSDRCAPPYIAPKIAGFYTQTTTAGDGTSTTRRVELAGGTLVGEIQIFRYDPQSREPIGSPERVVPFSVVLQGAETQLERVVVPWDRMSRIVVTSWNGQPARANGLANLWVPACS